MRITGGRARGIQLRIPKGDKVRPAMDRLRQAVFSSLGGAVEGAHFVDLFAGSGSYGLEALSPPSPITGPEGNVEFLLGAEKHERDDQTQ